MTRTLTILYKGKGTFGAYSVIGIHLGQGDAPVGWHMSISGIHFSRQARHIWVEKDLFHFAPSIVDRPVGHQLPYGLYGDPTEIPPEYRDVILLAIAEFTGRYRRSLNAANPLKVDTQ